jgi:hypothetical protein
MLTVKCVASRLTGILDLVMPKVDPNPEKIISEVWRGWTLMQMGWTIIPIFRYIPGHTGFVFSPWL